MFRPHWVILRPSKKTDPILHVCFTETHCGIPNAHRIWDPTMRFRKTYLYVILDLFSLRA